MSAEGDTTHELAMRVAIAEAEKARGSTGDNPWVGCVITDVSGRIIARGHTQGPGEDHAEIVAMHDAVRAGLSLAETTLYSTLEPCAFHGRTPACAHAIVQHGVRRVVAGMLDPNPRVDGAGLRILRDAGVDVIADVCSLEISRQLAEWVFRHHPHEPERRARALIAEHGRDQRAIIDALRERYGIDSPSAEALVERTLRAPG